MDDLSICRGNVFRTGKGTDTFKLSPELAGTDSSPILLQSISVSDKVIHLPVVCLDGTRIVYVFGRDFGDISVGGLALLGKGGVGDALTKVVSYYKANSVEDGSDTKVSVSLPGSSSYKFYLLGLTIQDPNPEMQYFPFMLSGKIVE